MSRRAGGGEGREEGCFKEGDRNFFSEIGGLDLGYRMNLKLRQDTKKMFENGTRYGPNRPAAAIGGGDFLVWTLLVASEAVMAFVMEELFRF